MCKENAGSVPLRGFIIPTPDSLRDIQAAVEDKFPSPYGDSSFLLKWCKEREVQSCKRFPSPYGDSSFLPDVIRRSG